MDQQSEKTNEKGPNLPEKREPRINRFSEKGIKTSRDFANLMSALMADLIDGRIGPETGSAICVAGGKLLKVIEMEYRYRGKNGERLSSNTLSLADTGSE